MSHDAGGGMRWLLTYADLITLLLVFFIIAYAAANEDPAKMQEVEAAVSSAMALDDRPFAAGEEGSGRRLDSTRDIGEAEGSPTFIAMLERSARVVAPQNAIIRYMEDKIVVDIPADDLFDAAGTPNEAAGLFLKTVGELMAQFPHRLEIAAYRPRSDADAWDVTMNQAVTLTERLATVHSVDPKRLTALGFGRGVNRVGSETAQKRNGISFMFLAPRSDDGEDGGGI